MKLDPMNARLRGRSPFEVAFDAAAGAALNVCPSCIGESTHRPWTIRLEGNEPLPMCSDCSGPVDHSGAAVGQLTDTGYSLKVIRLHAC